VNRAERRAARKKPEEAEYEPSGFARFARPTCSMCSGPVEWFGIGDAIDTLGSDQVNAFLEQLGSFDFGPDGPDFEFWRCRVCGQMGMFASPEVA
jgi:hypothetical protein